MPRAADDIWAEPKTERGATSFALDDGRVEVSALICGDGIDLVTCRPGHRPTTVQLTCDEARSVAAWMLKAADESPTL